MTRFLRNRRTGALPPLAPDRLDPLSFHRKLPGYGPTPLLLTPSLASRLGLSRVLVKNESSRFGLPSFTLLGASWATSRALAVGCGLALDQWSTLEDLARELEVLRPFTLAAATDGNHGRAVARMARLLGFESRIFVPRGTAAARIRAIEGEGATCTVVDGDYDAAIARSAEEMSERCLVIDDTSWPGYEEIPRSVIQGYGTIFCEIEEQIDSPPSVVFVPIGVGALGAAAVDFYKRTSDAFVIGVEPKSAAGVLDRLPYPSRGTRRVRRDRRLLRRGSDADSRGLRHRLRRDRGRGPRRARGSNCDTGGDGDSGRGRPRSECHRAPVGYRGRDRPRELQEDRGMKLRLGLLAIGVIAAGWALWNYREFLAFVA